ncbi:hypothetical protein CCC_04120 [Paramagnetospirillum magnetotacticum MS-1]|uniref:Uncharacterized protein n=1 Tax=Paramagnetospirillum magnetotacticum MS-1 TaxID=272627 RepID=A0A0C2YIR0_PARME|nr:hypothetical protein CCC_04120 [Paramagnetospirillum magnetotacticum MS-1]
MDHTWLIPVDLIIMNPKDHQTVVYKDGVSSQDERQGPWHHGGRRGDHS